MSRAPLFTPPFLLCSAANLAQAMAFNLFLHLPGYLSQLGANEMQIGLLFGLTSFAAIAVRPPIGRVMDRSGRRGVILLGGVLNSLVCVLYLTVTELGPWIYGLRVLHGVAEALLFTSLFTYAADRVPVERRTEGLALFGVSGMLPMALAGLLGDWILRFSGYAALFLTAEAFALASLLCSLPLRDLPRDGAAHEVAGGFGAALLQRDLLPLWWVGTIFATALASAFAFIKIFVQDTGIGSVGAFFAAYSSAALMLRIFGSRLPDRFGPKRLLMPSLASLAVGFLALSRAADTGDVIVAGILCGIGHGYAFPILFAMVVTRASDADRGSATAIFTALFDLGLVLGGPTFGWILHVSGFAAMYTLAAAVVVTGTVVFALWDRRR